MNKLKSIFCLLVSVFFISENSIAQTAANEAVPMADKLRADGKIWVVVAVIAVVFIGIAINMLRLESKVGKIEKELKIK